MLSDCVTCSLQITCKVQPSVCDMCYKASTGKLKVCNCFSLYNVPIQDKSVVFNFKRKLNLVNEK